MAHRELSDLAGALLSMLYRHECGGPTPPRGEPFEGAYRELAGRGLFDGKHLTQPGHNALHGLRSQGMMDTEGA